MGCSGGHDRSTMGDVALMCRVHSAKVCNKGQCLVLIMISPTIRPSAQVIRRRVVGVRDA